MDAHFTSVGRFELDNGPKIGYRHRCEESYKSRLAVSLESHMLPSISRQQEPLQLRGIQVKLLRGPVHSLPARNVNGH
ncbi:MAG TPA: hypothetical protein VKB88_43715 [Bryobacteraceae bacterium]|nr:hypothetical protein [Bryobacteraceae bacterium]